MKIVDFTSKHVADAYRLATQEYETAREKTPVLPALALPNLAFYAENGLGVALYENEMLLGFLATEMPFQNAFHIPGVTGIFSPLGANGAVSSARDFVYAKLYEAAAEKWHSHGATSHSICLYAFDTVAQNKLFQYGFGMRCADAIAPISSFFSLPKNEAYAFRTLENEEKKAILPLLNALQSHLEKSPVFMSRPPFCEKEFMAEQQAHPTRFFVLQEGDAPIAFLEIAEAAETFVSRAPFIANIVGAYLLPAYRGEGLYPSLLSHVATVLAAEGKTHLGVDFETFNPAAFSFWHKYFSPYTYSLTRRIDTPF